jgi:hypothetical protein
MDVINMTRKIVLIADGVLPIAVGWVERLRLGKNLAVTLGY